jgi:hypothetical protein
LRSDTQATDAGALRAAQSPAMESWDLSRLFPEGTENRIRVLKKGQKMAFFWACGVKSRGSGGAPPTHLILLRNQWLCVPRRDAPRPHGHPGFAGVCGGVLGDLRSCAWCSVSVVWWSCARSGARPARVGDILAGASGSLPDRSRVGPILQRSPPPPASGVRGVPLPGPQFRQEG